MTSAGRIAIAGAGIAGLTAALAFAARGFSVLVLERAAKLEEAGAGLQLSPNATRILERLRVLAQLMPRAVEPRAIVLAEAGRLRELARVPLGSAARARWGAPYLVVHRTDLQKGLLEAVAAHSAIEVRTSAEFSHANIVAGGVRISYRHAGASEEADAALLVGADGVKSRVREAIRGEAGFRFTGKVAWRSTVGKDRAAWKQLCDHVPLDVVSTFLDRRTHLVTYPLRGGEALNLVALTRGSESINGSSAPADIRGAFGRYGREFAAVLGKAGPWSPWPIRTVDARPAWTDGKAIALIGDAAHAMTPFAAQGAAMAIEDAAVLADMVAAEGTGATLTRYEQARRPRVRQVARRGAFNHFVFHAGGPLAVGRNVVLGLRPPERLAADLDWLYGWTGV